MLVDDLVDALSLHPDSTARDLAGWLVAGGVRVDEQVVNRILHSAHGRFRSDRGIPARWRVAGLVPEGRATSRPSAPATDLVACELAPSLYRWQNEALAAWKRVGRRGVVEAVTGAGKTMVGVAAVLEQRRIRGQALVLVPTKELQQQWLGILRRWCGRSTALGALGDGGRATLVSHDVVVAVVNSVREGNARPTRPAGLLVADECHRYASAMNRCALDERMTRRLGLSATYARDDDGHRDWLDPYFGGTCYELGYLSAAAEGVIALPAVALVGIVLGADERTDYEELTETLGRAAWKLIEHYCVTRHPYSAFMREVNALADRGGEREEAILALRYRRAVLERSRLLANAHGKFERVGELTPAVRNAQRTILFTQSIAASEAVADQLIEKGLEAAAIHSHLPINVRKSLLQRFGDGDLRVLSAPRILDEGIDVPAADLAVIVGASRTRRQMVQRMGRVLRVKPDGRLARFAILFAEDTVEDPADGAHEGFLSEVTSIAAAIQRFPSSAPIEDVNRFLLAT